MRVTDGEEAGSSDLAPGRNKMENSATTQSDRSCSFIAGLVLLFQPRKNTEN
jgi:hypothetical protein